MTWEDKGDQSKVSSDIMFSNGFNTEAPAIARNGD
jgi:hypothetical protein